jgi:hypothetical protein
MTAAAQVGESIACDRRCHVQTPDAPVAAPRAEHGDGAVVNAAGRVAVDGTEFVVFNRLRMQRFRSATTET